MKKLLNIVSISILILVLFVASLAVEVVGAPLPPPALTQESIMATLNADERVKDCWQNHVSPYDVCWTTVTAVIEVQPTVVSTPFAPTFVESNGRVMRLVVKR
jgi:hypothetical protein